MKFNSHGVTIHSEFSGGNILVDTCNGYHVELRPDIRDTSGHWFYWYFEVQVESHRRLHFHFPKDLIPFIGAQGLPFDEKDFVTYGNDWNTDSNYLSGKNLSAWAEEQALCQFSTVVEIPYANAKGTQIRPNRLREFGASLTEALAQSIQTPPIKSTTGQP